MRIILPGVPKSARLYRATCRNCDTEVEFMESEADRISDQRDGDYLEVNCPVCFTKITHQVKP